MPAPITKSLHEKTHGTAGVENGSRSDLLHDMIGDLAKEAQPVLVPLIGVLAVVLNGVVGKVILAVKARNLPLLQPHSVGVWAAPPAPSLS